ncbi:MAG: hypothetical protein IT428_27035 [Planctomycetaceae bacterium]|nr:hypothetical protein [Planctomycetaceae bacterium]
MSSTFEISSPASRSSDGEPESRIIHFDATERRREKMRKAAAGEKAAEATPSRPAPAAVKTAQAAVKAAPAPKALKQANPWQPAPAAIGNSALPAAGPAFAAKPAVNGSSHAGANGAAKPAAAPVAKAASPAGGSMDPKALETFLINFVVEQTGYPSEMVELDADLEADLGIDSIKKAQLFGELAEHFEVTASADLSLDDFPTLRHVMNFLKDKPTRGAGGASPAAPATNGVHTAAKPATNGVHTNGSTNGHHAAPVAKAAPAPAPVKPAPASAGMARADLEKFLVNFVVEQTGYPAEMVELDADLEADLGIDSIKKAQLFGELAEHFEVTASADLSLDDFPTLRHVCNFLADKPARGAGSAVPSVSAPAVAPATNGAAKNGVHAAPVAKAVAAPAPAKAAPTGDSMPSAELEKFLINFVVEQTGYPSEMVELDADLEADLGIDSIKKAQLFGELAEHFEVTASADLSLDDFPTLRHVMNFLAGVPRRR